MERSFIPLLEIGGGRGQPGESLMKDGECFAKGAQQAPQIIKR